LPDELRGEVVTAFVVLRDGHAGSEALAEELQQLVKDNYAAHAYPRAVHFVAELPKTPSGKEQRFMLRKQGQQQAESIMQAEQETPIARVTGAGSGIGRACAIALNEAGFELALAGRRQAPLDAVAGHISGRPLVVPTDVSDKAAVEHLFTRIEQHFGRLDLLFNNAGIFPPGREIDRKSTR